MVDGRLLITSAPIGWLWMVTFHPFMTDRSTQPLDQPTNPPTNGPTDKRAQRNVTLSIMTQEGDGGEGGEADIYSIKKYLYLVLL